MSDASTTPARTIQHPAIPWLKEHFAEGSVKFGVREFRDMVTILVPREHIVPVCRFLRDDGELRYDLLVDVNGVDYLNYPGGSPGRFAVNYGLSSTAFGTRLWLKVFLDPELSTKPGENEYRDEEAMDRVDPGLVIDSVTGTWPGAEWMEREVYDMFGIAFRGHPDLRRILTWNGFNARPLRKDYPLRGVGERENYQIISRETA